MSLFSSQISIGSSGHCLLGKDIAQAPPCPLRHSKYLTSCRPAPVSLLQARVGSSSANIGDFVIKELMHDRCVHVSRRRATDHDQAAHQTTATGAVVATVQHRCEWTRKWSTSRVTALCRADGVSAKLIQLLLTHQTVNPITKHLSQASAMSSWSCDTDRQTTLTTEEADR
jgi:hypothetical protein